MLDMNLGPRNQTDREREIERLQNEEGLTYDAACELIVAKEELAFYRVRETERGKKISLQRLMLPLVLLGVLIAAMAFRWNIEASRATDSYVAKWERDRWTGRLWILVYTPQKSLRVVNDHGNAPWRNLIPWSADFERQVFTAAWLALLTMNVAWLAVGARRLTDTGRAQMRKERSEG